jgi:hypothetical protein
MGKRGPLTAVADWAWEISVIQSSNKPVKKMVRLFIFLGFTV